MLTAWQGGSPTRKFSLEDFGVRRLWISGYRQLAISGALPRQICDLKKGLLLLERRILPAGFLSRK